MIIFSCLAITSTLLIKYFIKTDALPKKLLAFVIISTVFLLINFFGLYNRFNSRSLIVIFQFVTLINFTLCLSLFNWSVFKIRKTSRLAVFYILLIFLVWIISGFTSNFAGFYVNPNVLAPYLFYISFFVIAYSLLKKKKVLLKIIVLISFLLIWMTSSRSIFLAILFVALTYYALKFIKKYRFLIDAFFFLIILFVLGFSFVYPNISSWDHFYYFETLSRTYTGKSLLSGRELIWHNILHLVNDRPYFGYGTGTLLRDVYTNNQSSHNLYLQIALQNGYVGLIVFLSLLFSIWRIFSNNINDPIVRLSAAFFVGITIHQLFEVTLTQNNLSVGLMQWAIIAIGISRALKFKKQNNINQNY